MRFETDGEYPEHWVYKTIGDVCTKLTSGGTPSRRRPDFYENGTVGWIKTKELKDGPISNSEEYITHSAIKNSSAKLLPPSTVLMAMYGATVGMLGVLEKEMACNQACCAMIFDSELAYYRYVFYLLLNERQRIKSLATGAAQQNLSGKQISQFEFLFPPVSEQKKIAKVLGDLDKKIQVNNQLNQTLEQIAQAIFKSWFVDFEPVKAKMAALEAGGNEDDALLAAMQAIAGNALFASNAADADAATQLARLQTEHPEQYATLRATAELFPSAMQESELGEIPEGWGTGSFKDLCLTVESGGTPKRNTPEYWGGKIKWLASGEVRDVVVLDTKETITESGLKNSSAKLWPMYTTVVAMYGATAGQVCLIADQMTSNQACCGLIPKKNYKAFTFFSAKRSIQSLSDKASGSAQQNLNKGLVEGHQTILPAETILVVYEDLVFPLMLKWIENIRESVMLAEARDTLLPKLLAGELSINKEID